MEILFITVPSLKVSDQGPVPVSATESWVELPTQIVVPPLITAVGFGFTVTVTCAVPVQPFEVPVTVYVVVAVGLAVTTAPVVGVNPVVGLQLYVVAPLAVSEALLPLQIVADAGETVTTGLGLTVNVPELVAVQPFALVIVTEYVPATVVEKLATLPGFVTPAGTDHTYVYAPAGVGVALIVAGRVFAQTVCEGTLTVGFALTMICVLVVTEPQAPVTVTR